MCKAMEELIKDVEARGEARGESNGAIKKLIGLVKGMTESQFREEMKKVGTSGSLDSMNLF